MELKFNILQPRSMSGWHRYRNVLLAVFGLFFVATSIFSISRMVRELRQKELYDVERWVGAMEHMSHDLAGGFAPNLLNSPHARQNIPFIVLDNDLNVVGSHLVDEEELTHPDKLRRYIRKFTRENKPIEFHNMWRNEQFFLLYGSSQVLRRLTIVPYTQYTLFIVLCIVLFIALRSAKQGEQDRVWVGLAKETAHQLGTPISSLMGWIDYLREQNVEQEAVEEMARDLTHLLKVTDRFSKIGADTPLVGANVNEIVGGVVQYFGGRIPRGVTLEYNGLSMAPARANLNVTLFEWVLENLIKNSLDSLQGAGSIAVALSYTEQQIRIEVKDTGRGIPKGSWRKIFEPGFTTKSRGWGLGLSLSRRIVEEYHSGRIAVVASEIGVGTTFRITLNRIFDEYGG